MMFHRRIYKISNTFFACVYCQSMRCKVVNHTYGHWTARTHINIHMPHTVDWNTYMLNRLWISKIEHKIAKRFIISFYTLLLSFTIFLLVRNSNHSSIDHLNFDGTLSLWISRSLCCFGIISVRDIRNFVTIKIV